MEYNSQTGNYQAVEDGHLIEVDSDVFAESLADAQKSGKSYEEAFEELLDTLLWTGSGPMHGVSIDGVEQE